MMKIRKSPCSKSDIWTDNVGSEKSENRPIPIGQRGIHVSLSAHDIVTFNIRKHILNPKNRRWYPSKKAFTFSLAELIQLNQVTGTMIEEMKERIRKISYEVKRPHEAKESDQARQAETPKIEEIFDSDDNVIMMMKTLQIWMIMMMKTLQIWMMTMGMTMMTFPANGILNDLNNLGDMFNLVTSVALNDDKEVIKDVQNVSRQDERGAN